MGFYDRDYSREDAYVGPGRRARGGYSIVTVLIVINIAVHFMAGIWPLIYGLGAMHAGAVLHGQVWRLLTAQYLHVSLTHLFLNMLGLHFIGQALEETWGARKFFAVYTLCGLAGYVFYLFLGLQNVIPRDTVAVGASGCVYGLLGAAAVLFPRATVYVYFLFPIRIRTAAIGLALVSFLTVLQRGSNYGGEACHLAGLGVGVWWAMTGDRWWATEGSRWFAAIGLSGRNRVKPPRFSGPSAPVDGVGAPPESRRQQRETDQATIDRILKKVYASGIHSLTPGEKQALMEATERQRRDEVGG